MSAAIIYCSYTGMLEPLGQSQVLAYMERLCPEREVHLISFEKPALMGDEALCNAMAARIRNAGIHWYPLKYHKKFSLLATAWDVFAGLRTAASIADRRRVSAFHARSYVPAVIGSLLRRWRGVPLLFDTRGFWVDERADAGLWRPGGWLYRSMKRLELGLLRSSDHIVVLTRRARDVLLGMEALQDSPPPVTVIPTCVDLERFRLPPTAPPASPLTIGYLGSVGTWYRFDEVARAFAQLKRQRGDARFLVINRGQHPLIQCSLQGAGVPEDCVELLGVPWAEVPAYLHRMHAAVFFVAPAFSKQASAPTRLAELLASGVPCLSNHGVGDMGELLESESVGVAVSGFSPTELDSGTRELLRLVGDAAVARRCRAAAERHFSLQDGVDSYRAIYASLEARA